MSKIEIEMFVYKIEGSGGRVCVCVWVTCDRCVRGNLVKPHRLTYQQTAGCGFTASTVTCVSSGFN